MGGPQQLLLLLLRVLVHSQGSARPLDGTLALKGGGKGAEKRCKLTQTGFISKVVWLFYLQLYDLNFNSNFFHGLIKHLKIK